RSPPARARGRWADCRGLRTDRPRAALDRRRPRLLLRRRARARDALPDGRAPAAAGLTRAASGRPPRAPPRDGRNAPRADRAAPLADARPPPEPCRPPRPLGIPRADALLRPRQRRERRVARAGR